MWNVQNRRECGRRTLERRSCPCRTCKIFPVGDVESMADDKDFWRAHLFLHNFCHLRCLIAAHLAMALSSALFSGLGQTIAFQCYELYSVWRRPLVIKLLILCLCDTSVMLTNAVWYVIYCIFIMQIIIFDQTSLLSQCIIWATVVLVTWHHYGDSFSAWCVC